MDDEFLLIKFLYADKTAQGDKYLLQEDFLCGVFHERPLNVTFFA
ncbi:hypothetical protein EDC63_13029 [Sulfurirhabdus autotrophica]|uniref:Uncharacterized protein n=1 Tax=Sulfurirhabdus autotrophica TaxID=1706046 RepID=A0A4R3XR48_9PROT|nr:hypothetical protein EDC63_13029 [Sulfurirhabdus autotrophica]